MMTTIQDKWVHALRAGEFRQVVGKHAYLREGEEYTALGVLCELAKMQGVVEDYNPMQDVSAEVTRWVGLRVPYRSSVSLGDNTKSFAEMAGLIEGDAGELFE